MITCTEPQRWPAPPGPNAADSEIEAFIEHTEVCRFHADLLRDEEELLRREVTCARSVHPEGRILLTPEDRNLVERQRRQFLAWSDAPSPIKRLLVRVPGKTVAKLDLSRALELNFGVGPAPFLQIWKAGRWKRSEVLLATYPLQGFAHSGQRSYVSLPDGGFLALCVREVAPSRYECRLTCTQPATEAVSTSAPGWFGGGSVKLHQVFLMGTCLLLPIIIPALYYLRGAPPAADEGAVKKQIQEVGPEVARREDPQPPPSNSGSQGLRREDSLPERATVSAGRSNDARRNSKGGWKSQAPKTTPPHSSAPRRSSGAGKPPVVYSEVRSIHLDPKPDSFPQQLHDELLKLIADSGFTIEPSRDKADARLRIKTLPHGGWAFRLVNDSGLGIPVSTIRVDVEKQEEVKKAARQVVTALLQATSRPSASQ